SYDLLSAEALAAVQRRADDDRRPHESAEEAVGAVRALRRRELLRVGVSDLLGLADVRTVGEALTDIATVTIEAALQTAINKIEIERRGPLPTRFAVVAMGRF